MDSTIYFEVFVPIDILLRDVFGNYVVGDVAGTAAEISARPQVSSPKLLFQVRKLSPADGVPYGLSVAIVDQSADRRLRRQRDPAGGRGPLTRALS